MIFQVPENLTARDVVKRAMFLAWQACGGPSGLGILQYKDGVTEDDVWNNAQTAGDYPGNHTESVDTLRSGRVYGDYIFGCMMKVGFHWKNKEIKILENKADLDWNSWAIVYPTCEKLLETAIQSLQEDQYVSNS